MISSMRDSDLRNRIATDTYVKENVSVSRNTITVNATETKSVLQEYRDQGVDLQLTGLQPEALSEEVAEKQRKEEDTRNMTEMYQQNLEAAKENAEAMGEGVKDMGRALEIARRMMAGDIVPPSDEKFLMDYNKDIYMGAKNMQAIAQNEDSKKHDSVLEEKEEESKSANMKQDGGDISIDASSLKLVKAEIPNQ